MKSVRLLGGVLGIAAVCTAGCRFEARELCAPLDCLVAGSLDPSFGSDGIMTARAYSPGSHEWPQAIAVDAENRILVAGGGARSEGFVLRFNPEGAIDLSFGQAGVTLLPGYYRIYDLALAPDGRIVTVGWNGSPRTFTVHRLTADGLPDPSFGTGGRARGAVGGEGAAVAVQADGRIVVGGASAGEYRLARFDAGGDLDPTFGSASGVATNGFGSTDSLTDLAIAGGGQIYAGGRCCTQQTMFGVARYHPDGSLDAAFGQSGIATEDVAPGDDTPFALAIAPGGELILAGETYNANSDYAWALSRFLPDGSLDPSFNAVGSLITNATDENDAARSVVVDERGRIVVGGNAGGRAAVGRYLADGRLDHLFDGHTGLGDGLVIADFGGTSEGFAACTTQGAEHIVCAGFTNAAGESDLVVARYLSP